MHWAIHFDSRQSIRFLLSWDADLNIKNELDGTPLHLAINKIDEVESTCVVKKLILKGASRILTDNNNHSPLYLCKRIKNKGLRQKAIELMKENFSDRCNKICMVK